MSLPFYPLVSFLVWNCADLDLVVISIDDLDALPHLNDIALGYGVQALVSYEDESNWSKRRISYALPADLVLDLVHSAGSGLLASYLRFMVIGALGVGTEDQFVSD